MSCGSWNMIIPVCNTLQTQSLSRAHIEGLVEGQKHAVPLSVSIDAFLAG